MVYHCILQVHSIFHKMSFCLVTAPTSFICCKARLVTKVLSFMFLHNMYITKAVTYNEIILDESGTAENKEELLFSHDKLSLASILRTLHQVTEEMLV